MSAPKTNIFTPPPPIPADTLPPPHPPTPTGRPPLLGFSIKNRPAPPPGASDSPFPSRGLTKGWFSKRVVWADVPPERKPERGYIRMFPQNENRNEGTFSCSPGTKTRNENPERGHIRQNHPFTKPPFCLPMTLSQARKAKNTRNVHQVFQCYTCHIGHCNQLLHHLILVLLRCYCPFIAATLLFVTR